ncbi:type II toxin-antitoxin system RelE/ParE family toxin [Pseudomonadota bacterium]
MLVADMSILTYNMNPVSPSHKRLVWLSGEIKTPPISKEARVEAGYLLRLVQMGVALSMPESRSMPSIGTRCHELRIIDTGTDKTWRIVYRTYPDAVVILEVCAKKSRATPQYVVKNCKSRLKRYDDES